MITLYSMPSSGNSYKVRLLLAQLGILFHHVDAEWKGEKTVTRTAEFAAKNPMGKVPLVVFEDGRCLSESNAILLHFAEGTRLLPADPYERALAYQWMFFEQYSHEPNIAVRTGILHTYPDRFDQATPERLTSTLQGGNKALDAMETQLEKTEYVAGDHYSAADIALYAYTHNADKGGFDLQTRPAVSAWLERVRTQKGHVKINWLPTT